MREANACRVVDADKGHDKLAYFFDQYRGET